MTSVADVQNGTYVKLGNESGIVAAINSGSNVNVTYYMSEHDKYISEFKQWSKKTAQMVLEMGRVVFEAKKELGSQDFLKFCNEIGRKGEDATVRKYLAIGSKYEQFFQYANLLPNSWTSIYEITQLPSETFEALVATEHSLANMTGDQLKQLMGKKTEDKSTSSAASATAPTTEAPQTAKTAQNAQEEINAASTKTELSASATASSKAIQNDSSESVSQSADEVSDDKLSQSDQEFAKQATSTMLERVAATASTNVVVEAEEVFEPYEVTIRFNKMPSDEAKLELAEYVYKVKNKYRLDIEFVSNYVEV